MRGDSSNSRRASPARFRWDLLDDQVVEIDRQIAEGIAAEERGELQDGEVAMAEIRAELDARRSGG